MTKTDHDQFLAFRYPEFRYLVGANFLFTTALMMQEVILGYEMYKITGDPLAIGLLGLAQVVPYIGLSLIGGHLADLLSKKKVILFSLLGILLSSLALHFAAGKLKSEGDLLALQLVIYGVVFLTGALLAFYNPTVNALRAFVVPRKAYENSATWGSAAWQTGVIVGPGISGFVYAWVGFANTILFGAVLMACVLLLWTQVKDRKIENPERSNALKKIKEGLQFVWKTPMLLHSITLDLFSVLFGGVVAILPVFAEDILKVGPEGLGILRAAPAVGAILSLLIISFLTLMQNAWRTLLLYVTGFGIATLVFALSENFWLSVVALFFTGAFDAVSVVIRSTILQLLTPDKMRGRVGSVNGIFISASNELGAFESGLAASLMGTVPSVVFGGIASLAIVGFVWLKTRKLLGTDLRENI